MHDFLLLYSIPFLVLQAIDQAAAVVLVQFKKILLCLKNASSPNFKIIYHPACSEVSPHPQQLTFCATRRHLWLCQKGGEHTVAVKQSAPELCETARLKATHKLLSVLHFFNQSYQWQHASLQEPQWFTCFPTTSYYVLAFGFVLVQTVVGHLFYNIKPECFMQNKPYIL